MRIGVGSWRDGSVVGGPKMRIKSQVAARVCYPKVGRRAVLWVLVTVPARRGKGGDRAFTLCPIDTRHPAHYRLYFCDLVVSGKKLGGGGTYLAVPHFLETPLMPLRLLVLGSKAEKGAAPAD